MHTRALVSCHDPRGSSPARCWRTADPLTRHDKPPGTPQLDRPPGPARHRFAAERRSGVAHLRIVAISDLHAQLTGYDYIADRPAPGHGLTRLAAEIARIRRVTPNVLVLDNGDTFQGGPAGEPAVAADGRASPVMAALNELGLDAATLGNHDFDFGIAHLRGLLAEAAHPVVCANIAWRLAARPAGDRTFLPPFVVLQRTLVDGAGASWPLRVGVLGLLPPQTTTWNARRLAGRLATRGILEAADAWLPVVRARADIVVVLAHTGEGRGDETGREENVGLALARRAGIDALVLGHSHGVLARSVSGTPVVMPGSDGSHLGLIDLRLQRIAGRWSVDAAETAADPLSGRLPCPAVGQPSHAATRAFAGAPVGRLARPLHSHFALAGSAPALAVVAAAKIAAVRRALGDGLPVVAALPAFRAGGFGVDRPVTDVPAGPLPRRALFDLYPYANALSAVEATGAELAAWAERSAEVFARLEPGRADQPLLAPDAVSYGFDVLFGLSYRIDPTRPAGQRVRSLRLGGRPLDPAARVIVATNDYRAAGGGAFPACRPGADLLSDSEEVRALLAAALAGTPGSAGTGPDAVPPDPWRFDSPAGTGAWIDLGPEAGRHPPPAGLERAGASPLAGGALRYVLHLGPLPATPRRQAGSAAPGTGNG